MSPTATGMTTNPWSLLVYENAEDATKGKAIAEFLWWAIHDGQKLAEPLFYAPLPAPVVTKVEAVLVRRAEQSADRVTAVAVDVVECRALHGPQAVTGNVL